MKYTIEIELPDNDTVRQTIKTDEVEWFWHGYHGRAKAKKNRWIPCSRELPDEDVEVLVYLYGNVPVIAWVDSGRWCSEDFDIAKEDEPEAWMPLPPSYRGD